MAESVPEQQGGAVGGGGGVRRSGCRSVWEANLPN